MAQMLETESIVFRVTQGLRTWDQQQALWQRGRDTDDNIVAAAEIVTKAPPGYSWHNFGLAVDVVPDDATIGTPIIQSGIDLLKPENRLGLFQAPNGGVFLIGPIFSLQGAFQLRQPTKYGISTKI